MDFVNSATIKKSPEESIIQLGPCIKMLMVTLADNYNPNLTLRFTKIDIKDEFWCLQVNEHDSWNFVYVLPSFALTKGIDDINIFVPNYLHMEW